MNDCSNVTMREMLPDLLNDRLAAQSRAEVEAHLASCVDCRAELELLRTVRGAAPTPPIDAARIAARIAPYRATPSWVRATRAWPVRAAAAIILVVGAATMLQNTNSALETPDTLLAMGPAEVSIGAFTDVPDQDLRALMTELKKMQAVTPAEPEVVVPSVGRAGGGK
jgi:anti-sigma factor RsiW